MNITRNTQRLFRLQHLLFYVLLLFAVILLNNVAIKTDRQFDWTANARHSLSATTQELLQQLDQPVAIDVFVSPHYDYQPAITGLLNRYQQHSQQLLINYIDPAMAPDKVRQLDIQQQGEMVVSRGELRQHVFDLSEQSLTNAILSVARENQPLLVFIDGHDERSPSELSDAGLSTWAKQLESQGFKLQRHNLATSPSLPESTAAVVIASPLKDWLPAEVSIIEEFVNDGGNLLWFADPEHPSSLASLAELLGIEFLPGTVLDSGAVRLGMHDPRFILVQDYANHPIGTAATNVTLLADAVALQTLHSDTEATRWRIVNLLNSQPTAWVETSFISPQNLLMHQYDEGPDIKGPVALALLLTRQFDDEWEQRIAVFGDSDFVSNSYIGTLSNLELAMATANWLGNDDAVIAIPLKTSIGTQLNLSRSQSLIIGFGFLAVMPILLFSTGLLIWWQRRRR